MWLTRSPIRDMPLLRRAFSLLEVIVALAVILVMAAVALPSLSGFARQMAAEEAAAQLGVVRDALFNPGGPDDSFYESIGRNAGRLSELSGVIVKSDNSWSTGTDDSCGDAFKNGHVNDWEDDGPFVNFHIDRVTGLTTAIGRAEDSLTRIPNSDDPGVLRINFLNTVELTDATILDGIVDGGNGNATGTVQWVLPATDGLVTMYYFVPINDEC